jgi:UDP-glucose 4-epimerase
MLPIKRIVTVSSGGVIYGKAIEIPISEDHPTNPVSPYGISKLAIEKYAMMFYELKSLPVICVRPSNAYGNGQKPFIGQGFIATAIASVINQKEIVFFGDPGTIRDYIHVTDVADGIIAALENGKIGMCYNIGTGIGKDNKEILDIIQSFAKPANLDINIRKLPLRQYDVPVNILNSDKLKKDTDWEPNIPLIDGIETTWNWFYHKLDYGSNYK